MCLRHSFFVMALVLVLVLVLVLILIFAGHTCYERCGKRDETANFSCQCDPECETKGDCCADVIGQCHTDKLQYRHDRAWRGWQQSLLIALSGQRILNIVSGTEINSPSEAVGRIAHINVHVTNMGQLPRTMNGHKTGQSNECYRMSNEHRPYVERMKRTNNNGCSA